jgi:hypothetical protein
MIRATTYFQLLAAVALLVGVIMMTGCSSPDKVTRTTTTEQTSTSPTAPAAVSSTTTTVRQT